MCDFHFLTPMKIYLKIKITIDLRIIFKPEEMLLFGYKLSQV